LIEYQLPYEVQLKVIKNTLHDIEKKAEKEAMLYNSYFNHDAKNFEKIFTGRFDFEKPPVKMMYDKIFTQRNSKWADHLVEIATKKPNTYFVIVGAGHLFGPNNLLDLLRKKGLILEKIN